MSHLTQDQPIRLLLIEDNPGDARLFELMLTQVTTSRFDLTQVRQLTEGLACLESSCFDVLLLDLFLPDSQGFETFTRVQQSAKKLPIIILTGLDDEALAVTAVREGAQDYLVKGEVDQNLLVRSIRYAIERKQAEEQKAALREKEVLLQAIHHRVKNNLQVISSLLSLQASSTRDQHVIDILQDCKNRVHSMALVHDNICRSENLTRIDFSDYAHRLIYDLCDSYGIGGRDISLEIHVDDVSLGIDTAGPVGLILNELVSNSLEHAFHPNQPGEIRVEFRANNHHHFTLAVSDNGVGLPKNLDSSATGALGLRLVDVLIGQLDAKLERNTRDGTHFLITFAEPS